MTDKEKSREELLLELHKVEKLSKNRPRVLPSKNGVFLLDPTNPHDADGLKIIKEDFQWI